MKLEEFLLEIKLNNINNKKTNNIILNQKITENLIFNSKYLMRLSLTNMNLNDDYTI